ncbi:hypothetical protein SERLA73DRAFT_78291 [Serpula lacrymans var. lacrymans S7.3]|uniref:Uncharacterized protein n=1 Tax=Serpula lacrymans var. lacrymans (strain S7.3) TaxID=936435 RepID=F8QCP6_SERL3|nr:hypothetical protein SERLA73DRAFT_78291 [Serpula lacrymans var. lacrymans S7.3]
MDVRRTFLRTLEKNVPAQIGFDPTFGIECSLWPELRKIEFHEPCLDWLVLSEFLRKRKANNQPLETLRLCHTWEEDMLDVFPMLVASLERYVKVELIVIRDEEDLRLNEDTSLPILSNIPDAPSPHVPGNFDSKTKELYNPSTEHPYCTGETYGTQYQSH